MSWATRILLTISGSVCLVVGQTDPSCGPFQFATGYAAQVYHVGDGQYYASGLAREADGTLTEERFETYLGFKKLGSFPNAQTSLWNCNGVPPRKFPDSPPPDLVTRLGSEPVGTAARFQRLFQLDDGRAILLMINDYIGRNKLVVFVGKDGRNLERTDQYDVTGTPDKLVIGDFNGDGQVDTAVFSYPAVYGGNAIISIFVGNGDGTFTAGDVYQTSTTAATVATGDLNGDGKLDLVAAGGSANTVLFYAGNGNGTFATPVSFTSTGYVQSMAIADMNGDSKLDLLMGTGGTGIYYLPGNGDGTFLAPVVVATKGTVNYLAVGDFNEDGALDVVFPDTDASTISTYLAQPNGTYVLSSTNLAGYNPWDLVVTDVDLDGHLDIATGAGDPAALTRGYIGDTTVVLFGNGDGTYAGMPTVGLANAAATLVSADYNGDGIADLVVGSASGASLILGSSTGRPTAMQTIPLPPSGGKPPSISAAQAQDFNQDGKQDLALLANNGNTVIFLLGNGDGTFQEPITNATPAPVSAVAVGDFNGDGTLDLAGVTQSTQTTSTMMIFLGVGGFYLPAGSIQVGTQVTQLAVGDFNKDGKTDILALDGGYYGAGSGALELIAGNGNGTFQAPATLMQSRFLYRMALSDLNGDGVLDVVTAGQTDNYAFPVYVVLGKPEGGFGEAQQLISDFGPHDVAAGDLTGDGVPDLVVAHCCGDTYLGLYQGNGDGTFQAEAFLPQISSPSLVSLLDGDGDGRLDIVVSTDKGSGGGALAYLRNVFPRVNPLVLVNTASGQETTKLAPQSMASARGSNLATGSEAGDPAALTGTLGGASVKVVDSAGNEFAALIYSTTPNSIRFIVPDAQAGTATVTVTGADGQVWSTSAEIANVSPGFYSVNPDGLAQGYMVRVDPDGTQSALLFTQTNPDTGAEEPVAIDLGPEGTQVYLVLYGTGMRFVSAPEAGSISVGGEATQPEISASGGYPALDEIRFLLPRTLAGRGDVDIQATLDGVTSNTVKVRVQ